MLIVIGAGVCAAANAGNINTAAETTANMFKDFRVMIFSTCGCNSPHAARPDLNSRELQLCEMKIAEAMQSC
jgi:hypothetical protein